MSIWDLEVTISRRIIILSAVSVWGGLVLVFFRSAFWSAFGVQAIIWGSLFAGAAIFARRRAQNWSQRGNTEQWRAREIVLLGNTLWGGIFVSIVGVVLGLIVALALDARNSGMQGHGWGIVIQFSLLFVFNLIHTQVIPPRA